MREKYNVHLYDKNDKLLCVDSVLADSYELLNKRVQEKIYINNNTEYAVVFKEYKDYKYVAHIKKK